MAKRVLHILVDDLDASTDGVATHHIGLDGVVYEIDLTDANLARLRDALVPFLAAGRRLPKSKAAGPARPGQRQAPLTPAVDSRAGRRARCPAPTSGRAGANGTRQRPARQAPPTPGAAMQLPAVEHLLRLAATARSTPPDIGRQFPRRED